MGCSTRMLKNNSLILKPKKSKKMKSNRVNVAVLCVLFSLFCCNLCYAVKLDCNYRSCVQKRGQHGEQCYNSEIIIDTDKDGWQHDDDYYSKSITDSDFDEKSSISRHSGKYTRFETHKGSNGIVDGKTEGTCKPASKNKF